MGREEFVIKGGKMKRIVAIVLIVGFVLWFFKYHQNENEYYKKDEVFRLSEEKLVKFLEYYNQDIDEKEIEKDVNVGVNHDYSDEMDRKFFSYEIIKDSIQKKDFTDSYVVLNYEADAILDYKSFKKKYHFVVRFESTILSDSNQIPLSEIEEEYVWSIKWKEVL